MASSSTASPIQRRFTYDVFISFRGKDTRKNFVDHLYEALQRQGIHTYKDDVRIRKGKRISDELLESIEDSKLYIIVFSKDYASSTWCLDELVKIMECQKMTEHTAYPVFYYVKPSKVREQRGPIGVAYAKDKNKKVGEAFAKHNKNKKGVRKWREALEEATGLAGWELEVTANGHEAKFIQKIVEAISLELRSIDSWVDEKLVGMETRINKVVSSLEIGCDDVRMIGIKGIGGGGKTTLARAVFDQISFQFEGKSFVENVREVSKASLSGLKKLQKQVLSDVSNVQGITISSVCDGKRLMKKMMSGKKVLVVLDDVDHIEQLEALAGEPNKWFKKGSRIIITTRDEQVLVAHRVEVLDVNLLSCEEASRLFSRYAFGKEAPLQGYEELSGQVVRYADGLPLTIKVLGSFLCGKNESEWIDALERLKTIPLKETQVKLELSYESLEDDYKEIFLDVACLLKGRRKYEAIKVLESCGFRAKIGLKVLEQKSLITISEVGNLGMHDHIEEMGKNIVRRSHPNDPRRHSRLWIGEEIEDILANDKGTEATMGIYYYYQDRIPEVLMSGFGKMKNLRYLYVSDFLNYSYNLSDEVGQCLPNSLRYLHWENYPFKFLPKAFQPYNLVRLELSSSKLEQLWEGGERKVFNKLRYLDLFHISRLRTLDLRMAPNLETLGLHNCSAELHMPMEYQKLRSFNISFSRLRTLDLRMAPNLEKLSLDYCNDLFELHMPVPCLKLKFIDLNLSKLSTLDLGPTMNLETLRIIGSDSLTEIHMPIEVLKLTSVDISNSKLKTHDLGRTPNLETLCLEECRSLLELHMPIELLKLTSVHIRNSQLKTFDLGRTPNLERLILYECPSLLELHMPIELLKLTSVDILNSKLKTIDLGRTPNLEELFLDECPSLLELHMPIELLNLRFLNLSKSKLRALDLGVIPNITSLNLEGCHDLEELHAPIGCLENLDYLNLSGCSRFKSFSFGELRFNFLEAGSFPKSLFTCFYEEPQASSFGNLGKLISICLCACTNLERFSGSIYGLQCLRSLILEGSIPEAPKDLDQLECREELTLSASKIERLPNNICLLKDLKSLDLKSCWLLEKLPEDLDRLECLEKLILTECIFLQYIPNSICNMKRLKHFCLSYCILVYNLPEELGRLECLKELNIEGAGISHLPRSIFRLKGLRIVGSRWRLQSYGFTSEIESTSETFYIVVG